MSLSDNPGLSSPKDFKFANDGSVVARVTLEQSLKSDIYAMKSIAEHRNGCLVMNAWLRTGYITNQQMADMRYNGSLEDLSKDMYAVCLQLGRLMFI